MTDEAGGGTILDVSLVDPVPGHRATTCSTRPGCTWPASHGTGSCVPRIVQVDSEYEFRRADRGEPVLTHFDADGLGRSSIGALPAGVRQFLRL